MSNVILYAANATDFFNQGLGPLEAKDPKVTEVGNGEFYLELDYPTTGRLFNRLKNGNLIKADAGHELKDQRFEIKRVVKSMKQGYVSVYAEHISNQALDIALPANVTLSGAAQTALQHAQNSALGSFKPFTMSSDITTTNSTTLSIKEFKNLKQALGGVEGSILDTWGGEYKFDNYHISLLKKRGRQANAMIAYGRNLVDLEQEENIMNTFTSVYPYAVWRDKEGAEHIIEGSVIHSEHADKYPHHKVLPVDFTLEVEDDTKPTATKLNQLATAYINNNDIGIPEVSIRLTHLDLSKTLDYKEYAEVEKLNVFDEVKIYFADFDINTTAKIVRIVWNVNLERYDEIEVGKVRASLSDRINTIGKQISEARKEAQDARNVSIVAANGVNMNFFGPDEPTATKVGDRWFMEDGQYTISKVWDGVIWRVVSDPRLSDQNAQLISEQKDQIETMKVDVDYSRDQLQQTIANSGFTDLDTAFNSVQTLSEQAESNAYNAMQKAIDNASLIGGLDDSISTMSLEIDDINNSLILKANTTEIDRIDGTITDINNELIFQSGELSSKITQTQLQGAIDGIEIGGRNLIIGSDDLTIYPRTGTSEKLSQYLDVTNVTKITNPVSAMYVSPAAITSEPLKEGQTYTLSALFTYSGVKGGSNQFYLSGQAGGYVNIQGDIEEGKFNRVFITVTAGANPYMRIHMNFTGYEEIYLAKWKLEKGNKATDWTPAPEDNIELINSIQTEWTQTFNTFEQSVTGSNGRLTLAEQFLDGFRNTAFDPSTGQLSLTEQTINGLQDTVSDPVNGLETKYTQLSGLIDLRVTSEQAKAISEAEILSDKTIKDTRNDNQNPAWYFTNYPKQTVKEFKNRATIGAPGLQTYVQLSTEVPWSGTSGGRIVQTANSADGIYRRYSYSDNWSSWEKIADTSYVESQFSILDDKILAKVSEGDVYSQLLIDSRNILFDAYDRIMLSADKVVIDASQTFIPGAVIENASIDSAKISEIDASQVNVINLNANNIVTGYISGNRIRAGRIDGSNGYWDLETGNFITQSGGSTISIQDGAIKASYGSTKIDFFGSQIAMTGVVNNVAKRLEMNPGAIRFNHGGNASYINYDGSNIFMDNVMVPQGGRYSIAGVGTILNSDSGNFTIMGSELARGTVTVGIGVTSSFVNVAVFRRTSIQFYTDINVNGHRIITDSDRRIKNIIQESNVVELDLYRNLRFVEYQYKNLNKSQDIKFGLIAQEAGHLAYYDEDKGLWSIDNMEQIMHNSKAIQELALLEDDTNKVASKAYLKSESNEERIEALETELKLLKGAS